MKAFEIIISSNFSRTCYFLAYFLGPQISVFYTLGWTFIILISLVICSPE
ncbi:hypothetical protein [Pedobacter chinensis]|nr:hypothetical protein [Pedobacter chinensis]